ncbi:MAG: ATP-dependent Clp protease proteolytic subunit [Terracidiphilus sp.]
MSGQEPIRRDPKYRSNHDRSITISGVIDDALVSRLIPEIVRLQSTSRDPITAYIDSPGGDTDCARLLLDALRASDQDRAEPCRLITVALGQASSAASDILMAGDYALAFPYAKILCHGTRIEPPSSFTKDQAATYAKYMTGQDEGFAITLARNCIDRFMFRVVGILKGDRASDAEQSGPGEPSSQGISEIVHEFLTAHDHVGRALLLALKNAIEKANHVAIFAHGAGLFTEQSHAGPGSDFDEKVRLAILKDAADRRPTKGFSFGDLESEYLILSDFFGKHHVGMVFRLLIRWGSDLLSPQEILQSKGSTIPDPEKLSEGESSPIDVAGTLCTELWFLFVFFCRQLQTDDFPMTAIEAYWLGLIDEVVGLDLPSPRILVENAPDIPSEG